MPLLPCKSVEYSITIIEPFTHIVRIRFPQLLGLNGSSSGGAAARNVIPFTQRYFSLAPLSPDPPRPPPSHLRLFLPPVQDRNLREYYLAYTCPKINGDRCFVEVRSFLGVRTGMRFGLVITFRLADFNYVVRVGGSLYLRSLDVISQIIIHTQRG